MDILTQLTGNQGGTGISGILNQIFYAGLIIAVVLAIVMIVRGGLEYMTIDAASNKESAKNRIRAAIGGLVLCFSTIIILNTINPNLTNLSINFEKITNLSEIDVQGGAGIEVGEIKRPLDYQGSNIRSSYEDTNGNFIIEYNDGTKRVSPADAGPAFYVYPDGRRVSSAQYLAEKNAGADGIPFVGPPTPAPQGQSEQELRAFFAQHAIAINNQPCTGGRTTGCTNVERLGRAAVLGVVQLKNASGAEITITGGTEDGHMTHGVDISIVDLRKNSALDNYIINNKQSTRTGTYTTYTMSNGTTFMDEHNHWHVVFK